MAANAVASMGEEMAEVPGQGVDAGMAQVPEQGVDAVLEEGVVEEVPEPPYKDGDNPADGLSCYYHGCKHKGKSWGSILDHVRDLYNMGKHDINQRQNKYNKTKDTKGKDANEPAGADGEADGKSSGGKRDDVAMPGDEPIWKTIPCWVKCEADGTPLEPFECGGIADQTTFRPKRKK
jgi:hypothetical protein